MILFRILKPVLPHTSTYSREFWRREIQRGNVVAEERGNPWRQPITHTKVRRAK